MKKIKNPVLSGFHPDPCMICVDKDFYIANSTFEYYPSVQISQSRDLANWNTVNAVLTQKHINLSGNPSSGGVWAPCLSYHDEYFYIVFSDVKSWKKSPFKDTHNFITKSKHIEGPYDNPIYINSSGFDASLFHDDNGKKYFINMEWNWKETIESDQFTGILITELNAKTLKPISKPVKIFEGSNRKLTEGPHLFKRNNYYYLITAEGGTSYKHAVTIARSKNIFGPYKIHPSIHIATSDGKQDSPLQKTGHGSICKGPNDRWFLATLCGRPLDNTLVCPLGRETAINEIIWKDNWPYLKNKTTTMSEYFTGYGEKKDKPKLIQYNFPSTEFTKDFMSLRQKCDYKIQKNQLIIIGHESPLSKHNQSFLGRRQEHFNFRATTNMKFVSNNFQQLAGLIYRYDENNFYYLFVTNQGYEKEQTINIIAYKQGEFTLPLGKKGIILNDYKGNISLRIETHRAKASFSYCTNKEHIFSTINYSIDVHFISDEMATPMGFTGAFIGMQCCDLQYGRKEAIFNDFIYEIIE